MTSDKSLGCILGGALGDALGVPYEGKATVERVDWPSELHVSDDTQLTLATCEAIVAGNGRADAATIAIACFVQRCNEASTVETLAKFDDMKRLLLEEEDGPTRVFAELLSMRKKAGRAPRSAAGGFKGKKRQTYIDLHSERMNYAALRAAKLPIGSGVTEGTCRHIVVDRLRRSGMRWSHAGGQAVLTLRALRVSGDFDVAWKLLRAASDAA